MCVYGHVLAFICTLGGLGISPSVTQISLSRYAHYNTSILQKHPSLPWSKHAKMARPRPQHLSSSQLHPAECAISSEKKTYAALVVQPPPPPAGSQPVPSRLHLKLDLGPGPRSSHQTDASCLKFSIRAGLFLESILPPSFLIIPSSQGLFIAEWPDASAGVICGRSLSDRKSNSGDM